MKGKDLRIPALIRFALAITALNLVGHLYLGFEPSYAHIAVALLTAYSIELLIETIKAKIGKRPAAYTGGIKKFILFLLPGHISGLAISMLIFPNVLLMPIAFAVAVALLSKTVFRVKIKGRSRHFLNPSNTGIAISFLLFPFVSAAPPYQFTEAPTGIADFIIPLIFITLGSFLNSKYTKRMPLIAAWLIVFFLQAVIRTSIMGTDTLAAIGPMTGVAFLLFTFYMVSDPSTTPSKTRNQIFFGSSVAAVYSLLMAFHIVFGLFFSLLIVCSVRGAYFFVLDLLEKYQTLKQQQRQSIQISPGLSGALQLAPVRKQRSKLIPSNMTKIDSNQL